MLLGACFLCLIVGVAIGLVWKDNELNEEIALRKRWQQVANELTKKLEEACDSSGSKYQGEEETCLEGEMQ